VVENKAKQNQPRIELQSSESSTLNGEEENSKKLSRIKHRQDRNPTETPSRHPNPIDASATVTDMATRHQ
jgi:hypothetical protein